MLIKRRKAMCNIVTINKDNYPQIFYKTLINIY